MEISLYKLDLYMSHSTHFKLNFYLSTTTKSRKEKQKEKIHEREKLKKDLAKKLQYSWMAVKNC